MDDIEKLQSDVNGHVLVAENSLKRCMEQLNSDDTIIIKFAFKQFTDFMAFYILDIKENQEYLELNRRPQNTTKLHELTLELEKLIEIGNRKIAEQNN